MTLRIDFVQQVEGHTAYRDADNIGLYYVLPQQPRYRRNADGSLAFRFMKYRSAVDRPDGKKGGFLLFDVEFVVDEARLPRIRELLTEQIAAEANRLGIPAPPLQFGAITYVKGSTQLFVAGSDGSFVEKLHNPGKPSLYGNNVTSFALELSEQGATFFEQAMQGAGGAVSVVYDLTFVAQLAPIRIDSHFFASKFYSFYQEVDTEWNLWAEDSYRETIRQTMISNESMVVNFSWGGVTDEKIKAPIRDWAVRSLEDAIERNMIEAIAPVSDDQRKIPDGIEDVTRNISETRITDIDIYYNESQTVEWNLAPQGMLQNITELTDAGGARLKWSDYVKIIDLDDSFFRQLRVDTFVNADFDNLPIHSVEVKVLYNGRPMPNLNPDQPEGEVVLNTPAAVGKFATYVENDNWKYKYSYQVNYRGQSRIYQSPEIETNEGNLTIGVDDVGILSVNVTAGDLNWSIIERALVTFSYEDAGVTPIEEQFQLSQNSPSHLIQRVIFEPMRRSYTYRVRYYMKNGKEFDGEERKGRSNNLFINDVFGGRRTVSVRGLGDFSNRIQTVFVDLKYEDTVNGYTDSFSQALSADALFFDWPIPVISETGGIVKYKATIAYKDGTSETIPETVADSDTILLPPAVGAVLDVTMVPDLIDWSQVRLARVSLTYDGLPAKDFIFSPSASASTTWRFDLKDGEDAYSYKIVYFMTAGMQKTVGPTETSDQALILDPQSNV